MIIFRKYSKFIYQQKKTSLRKYCPIKYDVNVTEKKFGLGESVSKNYHYIIIEEKCIPNIF